ncbi:MAG TPA: SRPBCC family protein [Chitinophagaceae bacterium]
MGSKNETIIIAEEGKQELFIEREFDAPAELLFRAFNEPEFLVQWLGPQDMEMEIDRYDNRSGGSYRFIHRLPNGGGEFSFNGVIHEVDEPRSIIRTFEFEGHPERGHVSLEFLTIYPLSDSRSKIHIQTIFKSVAYRDEMVQSGMESGMNEGFKKLDELLASHL